MAETPALFGGEPAKKSPWGTEKRYGDAELQELKEALDQDTLFYAYGKKAGQLEQEFAARNGVRFGVVCSSGTSAIHSAMMAAGISPGDEVITSPVTDMGSIAPILFQGAIPVFADLHPHSYTISPDSVEANITPRTKAVLAVHLWGNACDMNALLDICNRHNLTLIEDCAQAFGCTYDGKPVGTIGRMGCFSFNEFKHIACGDGGIIITDDEALASKLRLSTDKCYSRDEKATIRDPWFLANNYRMTELQAAVALAQLKKLDSIVARRRKWCTALSKELSAIKGISVPQPTPGCDPSWWFYMLRVDEKLLGANVDEFTEAVKAEGLSGGAHYTGRCIYEYPVMLDHSAFDHASHAYSAQKYAHGLCPTAEEILDTCFIHACHEAFTEQDLQEVIHGFKKVAAWFNNR
jgi:dTDP-4-amino-4,6-dideoxygalactose transaminase